FAVGGVAVDHRVHVAGGDAIEQVGLAQLHEVVFAAPVRLGNDADAIALGFQQTANDRHAERRMVDIGVSSNNDHITAVPAELIHLFPAHWQEGCRTETLGPVLGIVEQGFDSGHGGEPAGYAKRARNIAQNMAKSDASGRIWRLLPPQHSKASTLLAYPLPEGAAL